MNDNNKVSETDREVPFERLTDIELPFNMRNSKKDGKDYGVQGLYLWYILKGQKGAIEFCCQIPFHLPSVDIGSYKPEDLRRVKGYALSTYSSYPFDKYMQTVTSKYLHSGTGYYETY